MSAEATEQTRKETLTRARRLAQDLKDPDDRYQARMICYALEDEEDTRQMFDP